MIAGLVVKCWMLVMRVSHSGKAFHVAFAPTQIGLASRRRGLGGHPMPGAALSRRARIHPNRTWRS